jgi:hypothetical protein
LSGRVEVSFVADEELVVGGGVLLGASCANAGIASTIARKPIKRHA